MVVTIILVDMSQVQIANLMAGLNNWMKGMDVDERILRHMILNTLRSFREQFSAEYGELVLCYDSHSWRKDRFPYYKAARKKKRQDSGLDWNEVFEAFGKIENDMREHFPYATLRVDRAEADDIIGAIVIDKCQIVGGEKVLIISGDHDFIQLHNRGDVTQWSPTLKKFVKHDAPARYLAEHICRGDSGDGIPNVLSDDDTFVVEGKRQKQLRAKALEELITIGINEYDYSNSDPKLINETTIRNYARNEELIDINRMPEDIRADILHTYKTESEAAEKRGRKSLYNYFVANQLVNLLEDIGEF
jgi:5'-3' exonuclease